MPSPGRWSLAWSRLCHTTHVSAITSHFTHTLLLFCLQNHVLYHLFDHISYVICSLLSITSKETPSFYPCVKSFQPSVPSGLSTIHFTFWMNNFGMSSASIVDWRCTYFLYKLSDMFILSIGVSYRSWCGSTHFTWDPRTHDSQSTTNHVAQVTKLQGIPLPHAVKWWWLKPGRV